MVLILFARRKGQLSSRSTGLLNKCNNFLPEIYHYYCRVYFSSSGKYSGLNGLFTSDGLIGMFEAIDYSQVETFMQFFGSLCDRALNDHETTPVVLRCELSMVTHNNGTNIYTSSF